MSTQISVQRAGGGPCPSTALIRRWLTTALEHTAADETTGDVCVRLVGEAEMSSLNHRYRSRTGPTDVLAFPAEMPVGGAAIKEKILGDIVACAPVVRQAAMRAGLPINAHWAHILVHGLLHLLGHDHQKAQQATAMARAETAILAALGFASPHGGDEDASPC